MKKTRGVMQLFLGLLLIFFIIGCSPYSQNQYDLSKYNSGQKIYIKNDTKAYNRYEDPRYVVETLKRGEEYTVVAIKNNHIELGKVDNNSFKSNIWVSLEDTETEKTYFLTLMSNASNPTITINNQNYQSNMRLTQGTHKVNIKADNFLEKDLAIEILEDTHIKIALDFDMEAINKKMEEAKIKKELKESIFIDNNQKLMWQDDTSSTVVKKPWLTEINYNSKNYNDTKGNTAKSYCTHLTLANFKDWRLPTKEELKMLSKQKQSLKNIKSDWYWSATTSDNSNELAWSIFFDNGDGYADFKNMSNFVRCVRDN